MVFGGRQLLIDQAESGTWRMNLHFLAQDENGDGRLPVVRASDCVLTPSWDDADVLFMLQERRSATIALVPRSKLFAALKARSAAAAEGRVVVALRDGSILCVSTGGQSVE